MTRLYPQRRTEVSLTVLGCLALMVLLPLILFAGGAFYGFFIMIGLGITHAEFGWPDNAVGFWPCFGLGLVFSVLTAALRRGNS